MKIMTG